MKARVHVTLKPGVLDPQGEAVRHALGALGFDGVGEVRIGKVIELELAGRDRLGRLAAALGRIRARLHGDDEEDGQKQTGGWLETTDNIADTVVVRDRRGSSTGLMLPSPFLTRR